MDTSEDPVTSEVLLALQLRAVDNPLFPRLKAFECKEATEAFIPFIPLLLSPTTTSIEIRFAEDTPTLVVASMVSRFSTLCPNLEYINLPCLPRDSVITNAVSEMLLACNRDILRAFEVDSPLTEEAREVVYRLPRLSDLWTVIRGSTSLPTVVLPNLDLIDIDYDNHLDWLEGFRGATLGRLKEAYFRSGSEQIGDFLGTFERVALATSTQNTLSTLKLYVPRSWNPNYSSLLSFKRLKELEIQFSCGGGCSSKVDDEVVISLAQVMPELEVLQLGKAPCRTPTGITINGLIGLACNCPRLSNLRIHFQATSLVNAVASAALPSPSEYEPAARQEDCVLVDLEVGEIPIPVGSASTLALILLQIFPRILNVVYTNQEWKVVAETVKDFRRIRALVRHSSKTYSSIIAVNDP